jgi:hypothetical protein
MWVGHEDHVIEDRKGRAHCVTCDVDLGPHPGVELEKKLEVNEDGVDAEIGLHIEFE